MLRRSSVAGDVVARAVRKKMKGIFFATKHDSVDRGSSPEVSDVGHHRFSGLRTILIFNVFFLCVLRDVISYCCRFRSNPGAGSIRLRFFDRYVTSALLGVLQS